MLWDYGVFNFKDYISKSYLKKNLGSFDLESFLFISYQYRSLKEWRQKEYVSYKAAKKAGFLEDFSHHMKSETRSQIPKETILRQSRIFDLKSRWKKYQPLIFAEAEKRNLLEDIYHFPKKEKFSNQELIEISKKYLFTRDWKEDWSYTFRLAEKRGLFQECKTLVDIKKPDVKKWSKREIKHYVGRCPTRTGVRSINPKLYKEIERRGLLDEILPQRPTQIWSMKSLVEDARKYKTPEEWRDKSYGYRIAYPIKDLYEMCIKHMKV